MSTDSFLLRLDPELLDQARKAAEAEELSVSDFLREGVVLRLKQAGISRSASREDLLREIADIAAKIRKGYVLVPSAEVPRDGGPDSWSGLMEREGP